MKQATLTIMCGIPACGKSTWIEKNKKSNCDVVCLDDIRRIIFGHQFHRDGEPWVIAFAKSMAKMLLNQKRSVIIDATNVMPFMRNDWKSVANQYGARTELILFYTSLKECRKRNRKRKGLRRIPDSEIDRFAGMFVEPDFSIERYDKVICVRE